MFYDVLRCLKHQSISSRPPIRKARTEVAHGGGGWNPAVMARRREAAQGGSQPFATFSSIEAVPISESNRIQKERPFLLN